MGLDYLESQTSHIRTVKHIGDRLIKIDPYFKFGLLKLEKTIKIYLFYAPSNLNPIMKTNDVLTV